jgi:phosphoribosyl 1,2-cyclic phosphodiesterase
MSDKIRFFGVRGSIAAPGPDTRMVGGNTSCVEVCLGGQHIILDGGTGLRALGAEAGGAMQAAILFSHLHWDHIQGIPFFGPLYHPESDITLYGPRDLKKALEAQMSAPSFPVSMEVMGARLRFVKVFAGDQFSVGEVKVVTTALNHPGGAIGYRLCGMGRTVAYVCDNEHKPDGPGERLLELARGADVLIYDAQYLPEEYGSRKGWGHSTYVQGAELATRAGVGQLILTHHEPSRTDSEIARIEREARKLFEDSWAAREGMEFEFGEEKECWPATRLLECYLATALPSG